MAEIIKVEKKLQQVFGWAYVASPDGGRTQVVDKSGDFVALEDFEELEKAAYEFVLTSRQGGDFHSRVGVSDMIESMVFTPEKIEKMGLPDTTPLGWWVGFKVNDAETWERVEKGMYTQFSVHGAGIRTKVAGDA